MKRKTLQTTVLPMVLGAAVGLSVTIPQAVRAESPEQESAPQKTITVQIEEDPDAKQAHEANTRMLAKLVHAEKVSRNSQAGSRERRSGGCLYKIFVSP